MENDDGDEREGTARTASKQGGRGEGGTSSNSNGHSNSKHVRWQTRTPRLCLSGCFSVCLSASVCASLSLLL